MSSHTLKHSKEAQAFLTLFKAMKPEVKREVRDIINREEEEIPTEILTAVSMDSFHELWDTPENEPWDDFIKGRLKCTDRETL